MKKNYQIIVIILGLLSILAHSSSTYAALRFEHISNKQGFNQNTINVIEQDHNGDLWFGTPNGLIQYDGYDFIDHTHSNYNKNSICNNYINSLFVDDNGALWIGTRGGLDVYLPKLEKFMHVPLGSTMVISHIESSPDGQIWLSSGNKLFYCKIIESENKISFKTGYILNTKFNLRKIKNFYFASNNLCLLNYLNGFRALKIKYNSNSQPYIESVINFSNLNKYSISNIIKIDDIYWIGTDQGLFQAILNGDQMQIIQKIGWNTSLTSNNINSIYKDNFDNVWIATKSHGIYNYNNDEMKLNHFKYDPKNTNGISSSNVNCFHMDKYDVLWIGTAQGGISKLDLNQKQFISYSHNPYDKNTISGNLITAIFEDHNGKLWVADYDELLCRSTNPVNEKNIGRLKFESLKHLFKFEKKTYILSIYEDAKGYIWFGTNNSIYLLNPDNSQIRKIDFISNGQPVELTFCQVIEQFDDNRILFGGDKLLIVDNPWIRVIKDSKPSIKLNAVSYPEITFVKAFQRGEKDQFWVGTRNGLYRTSLTADTLQIKQYFNTQQPNNLTLNHSNIASLLADDQNNLWIGTFGGGLNKMYLNSNGEPVKIESLNKDNILPNDAVYSISQENDDFIWFSTDMGLCRMSISNNHVDVFDVRDGLPNNNFRQSAYFQSKSGYFFFGGLNGLTVFKPETIKMNKSLAKPLLTGISINNTRVKVGQKIFGKILLKQSAYATKRIEINQKTHTLTLHLAVQHSAIPTKNQLAYMLEGFNNNWILARGGKTSVTYTNLPAGEYTFKMKAANNDGVWNEEARILNIEKSPPWYNTWWSYTIFITLAVFTSLLIMVYYIRQKTLQHELKYEQIDKKRVEEVNQGKLQFFTNISHELRTPLTLIAGPLENAIEQNTTPENEKYLKTIKENTKRLLHLIDQLTTFRKIEQGHLALKYSQIEIGDFIFPTTEAFENYALQKNINFFYKINSPNEEMVIDVEKTERIIFNLLSNSFRHTPGGGDISISSEIIKTEDRKLVKFNVIDTGKGIPLKEQEKIFERFYQVEDRKGNTGGTGIGLAYCKSLVNMMKGSITVESEPGVRTCFSVTIPSNTDIEDNKITPVQNENSFIKDWIPGNGSLQEVSTNSNSFKKNGSSVLIIDDEDEIRDFLAKELYNQYNIITAKNGLEGLEKLKHFKPDVIICDILMPELNGLEVCEKVKSSSTTCHIPFILLTALDDIEDQIKGLESGADDYISKPFSPKHIKVRIQKLIENRQKLNEYFSKNSIIPDNTFEISGRNKKFLEDLNLAIDRNISDSNFGVEELANEIGISTSHFYRKLKQLTGQVPNAYLRNYRLQKAAELMRSNEGYNGLEVMYQIGIESNSYFSTAFKKRYGVRPSAYIKKYSHNKVNNKGKSIVT